jgi:hypothetical protein
MGRSRSARTALVAAKARASASKVAPSVGRTLAEAHGINWLVGAPYGKSGLMKLLLVVKRN